METETSTLIMNSILDTSYTEKGLEGDDMYATWWLGPTLLVLSALAGGFGNSLEPVSILTVVQIILLILGFDMCTKASSISWKRFLLLFAGVVVTQGLGFCLGFSSLFGYPRTDAGTVATSFGAGLAVWILVFILALWPHYAFSKRFPSNYNVFLVFPVCFTMVNHCIVGSVFSTFPCLGNAVLDYAPLKQLASLLGIASLTFCIALIGTLLAAVLISHKSVAPLRLRQLGIVSTALVTIFMVTGFLIQADSLYQKNVSELVVPVVPVSCIATQNAEVGSIQRQQTWNSTEYRASQGDRIILWSEEAFLVSSSNDETDVLNAASGIAATHGTYIGVTYQKQLPGESYSTNQFALVTPDGTVAWNYLKAHPVPAVEEGVRPGPEKLPVHSSSFGTLAGSICFDMDYPQYIRQAGEQEAKIMLQSSWTWNAINFRHFDGNAVRAVENGFTIFRCSSNGESGIVDPRGQFKARQFTGSDPASPALFSLPLIDRVSTMFTAVGFVFEWFMLAVAIVYYFLVLAPDYILVQCHLNKFLYSNIE